jgi:P-type Mg2+ transporter
VLFRSFGFVPLPAKFYFILGVMVLLYLCIVELIKQRFYKWSKVQKNPHADH